MSVSETSRLSAAPVVELRGAGVWLRAPRDDDGARLECGIGGVAVELLLAHAFGSLGLNRVSVRVLADNQRATQFDQKVGFVREGCERQAARVSDAFVDGLIMGILASEFGKRVA